ncbi:hypothetical protein HCA69_16005 [Listeria grandensis]|uniref:Uncharacterized protein n=1 Tax=Listeria grandensis TaxID=1494963 RepID=A0A7X1CRA3_9LIST|nr:hypothetical protein [Listeria grandensis]MBC1937867.1 hypothetical protein [Listeria grandensis]
MVESIATVLVLAILALILVRNRREKKSIRAYYRDNGLAPVRIKIISSESTGTLSEKQRLKQAAGDGSKIEVVKLGQDYKYVVFLDKKVVEVKEILG